MTHSGIRLTNVKDNEILGKLVRSAASGDNGDMQAKSIDTTANHADVQVRIVVLPIGNDEQRQLDDDEASVTIIMSDQNRKREIYPTTLQSVDNGPASFC